MSVLEMKVPSPGESITEVEIAEWMVEDGDYVEKDQTIAEVDSDKATLELPAEQSGIITLKAEVGDAVEVGQIVCLIDTSAEKPEGFQSADKENVAGDIQAEVKETAKPTEPIEKKDSYAYGYPSVAAKKMIDENELSAELIQGSGRDGRVTKGDVIKALRSGIARTDRQSEAKKMSMLRRKIASRLVAVKNETAMLTTFNEVDMKPIMDLRKQFKDEFKEK